MPSPLGALVPYVPFPEPVPIPVLGAGSVNVTFDQAWTPYLLGCIKALLNSSTYDPSPVDLELIIKAANDLLYAFTVPNTTIPPTSVGAAGSDESDIVMIRQNPTNPCLLESSVDGIEWCVWADLSKCVGYAPQPGPTPTPNPSSCGIYTFDLPGNGQVNVPVGLDTGDTYQILEVNGATADGSLSTAWRCWDGFQFFLGTCTGLQVMESGDPIPTYPHQHVIASIGGVWQPLDLTVRTVGAAISNSPLYVQINDSNLTDNTGNIQVKLQICKAAVVPPTNWTATIDLTIGIGPFTVQQYSGQNSANWAGGIGFQQAQFNNGDFVTGIYIKAVITAFTMLRCRVFGSVVLGNNTLVGGSDVIAGQIIDGTLEESRTVAGSANGAVDFDFNPGTPQAGVTAIEEFNYASDGASVSYQGGTSIINEVIIDGTGPIPPELAPYV